MKKEEMIYHLNKKYQGTPVTAGSIIGIVVDALEMAEGLVKTDKKYCDDCKHIIPTPLGSYCDMTGKNLYPQSDLSHDERDTGLIRECNGLYQKNRL